MSHSNAIQRTLKDSGPCSHAASAAVYEVESFGAVIRTFGDAF